MSRKPIPLGKDSELAATLAQGKPVIAYVPKIGNLAEFKQGARKLAAELEPGVPFDRVVRDFLKRFYPQGAWEDPTIMGWLSNPTPSTRSVRLTLSCSEHGRCTTRGPILCLATIHWLFR